MGNEEHLKPPINDSRGQRGRTDCPIPSAHDKITEAHYFLHRMIENYHDPDQFRFNLSAFLQAVRSATFMVQSELGSREHFAEWYGPIQTRMREDSELRLLNEFRTNVVHLSTLALASSMFIGHFKNGHPKAGFLTPLDPMRDSYSAFLNSRPILEDWEHPHRVWCGEELGLERTWSLPELQGRELVDFCISAWEKIAEVVGQAHKWAGAGFSPEARCKHIVSEYRSIRESEIFVEVGKAWDGEPTEELSPKESELLLLEVPDKNSKVLHRIAAPDIALGWVGVACRFWPNEFLSMLVYSIGGETVSKNTAVFFEAGKALIKPVAHLSDVEPA